MVTLNLNNVPSLSPEFNLDCKVPTLTSQYFRWRPVKGGNIVRTPGLQFPNGFHIQITEKDQRKHEQEYTIKNQKPKPARKTC
jgi:hypothetical protein